MKGVLLVLLVKVGVVPDRAGDSDRMTSRQLQDLLICFEMLAAATAMHLAFAADVVPAAQLPTAKRHSGRWCFGDWFSFSARISADILSPSDVIRETEETAGLLTASIEVTGEVQLSVNRHVEEGILQRLTVHVAQARNLAAGDVGGVSDPYALIQLHGVDGVVIEGGERKTQVVTKTLNPQWDCWFRFEVDEIPNLDDTVLLFVQVFDEDYGHLGGQMLDDSLGQVTLSRTVFFEHGVEFEGDEERIEWYQLTA